MSALCFAIVQLLPLFTKAIPSSLVGLVVASGVGTALKLPLETLSSSAAEGTFTGGLASLPRIVDLGQLQSMAMSPSALKLVLPASISIAIIALVETLLSGKVVDEMIGIQPATEEEEDVVPTRSVIAMSIGNVISSLLGGFGGCGLIPQTVLNVKSGGRGQFSSISYALAMASFVLVFAPFVGKTSQAALAGVMIGVAYDTVAWKSSLWTIITLINPKYHRNGNDQAIITRIQRLADFLALAISTVVCYSGNLAVGIISGVIVQRGLLSISQLLGHGTKEVGHA